MTDEERPNRIRELLDDAEISIEEFAELVGITEKSMSNYYYGWRNPGKRLALNMAKILDVDVWYLLGYDSEQEEDYDLQDYQER